MAATIPSELIGSHSAIPWIRPSRIAVVSFPGPPRNSAGILAIIPLGYIA